MPEIILYSFRFLTLDAVVFQCFPTFVSPHLQSSITWTQHLSSLYSFIFNSTLEVLVSQLRTFLYIPHLLGLLHKCFKFPGVLTGLFTSSELTITRTFYTNFRLAILLVKTVRRSNTCLIKDLTKTKYSDKDGEYRQDVARNIYPFHILC